MTGDADTQAKSNNSFDMKLLAEVLRGSLRVELQEYMPETLKRNID